MYTFCKPSDQNHLKVYCKDLTRKLSVDTLVHALFWQPNVDAAWVKKVI